MNQSKRHDLLRELGRGIPPMQLLSWLGHSSIEDAETYCRDAGLKLISDLASPTPVKEKKLAERTFRRPFG
jgi:hypothetical protein